MKQIILERNVVYAVWENLMYALVFSGAMFIGTTFFSSGNTGSLFFGIITSICITFLIIKKGLVMDKNLYRGYFVFGKLVSKKKIINPNTEKFTLVGRKLRQKYDRSYQDPNWEYTVDSFELYFINEEGEIKNEIIKCRSHKSAEEAKEFLLINSPLKFVSFY